MFSPKIKTSYEPPASAQTLWAKPMADNVASLSWPSSCSARTRIFAISNDLGFVFQFIHEFIRGFDAHAGFACGGWLEGQNCGAGTDVYTQLRHGDFLERFFLGLH